MTPHTHGAHRIRGFDGEPPPPAPYVQVASAWRGDIRPRRIRFSTGVGLAVLVGVLGVVGLVWRVW